MEMKMASKQWEFPGCIFDFMDLTVLILTFAQAVNDDRPDKLEILTNPETMQKVANEYGITIYTVAQEMMRIAPMVIRLLEHAKNAEDPLSNRTNKEV